MATYKMKSTQKGVRPGAVHPVTFHAGKTYEIGDDLAGQFQALDAIEESSEEPVAPDGGRDANRPARELARHRTRPCSATAS